MSSEPGHEEYERSPDTGRRSLLRNGIALSLWALVSRATRGALPGRRSVTEVGENQGGTRTLPAEELVPSEQSIYEWIERISEGGIRRPGYAADRRAEQLCLEHFRDAGLENVRLEPVELPLWEPRSWSLSVHSGARELTLPCFPLPHSAPTAGLEAELVEFDGAAPERVEGKASLFDLTLQRLPSAFPVAGLPASAELAIRLHRGGRIYDPKATFDRSTQILPFGPQVQEVMEPSITAGAIAFIGVLADYPGDSMEYYVPYDGKARPIPGVWIRGSDGSRLRSLLASGPVQITLQVDSVRRSVTSHNVLGELTGPDEELVVIGSHHDGPWESAVEDASGTALVLAQASYWASVPRADRPHRLVFLVNAGHMVGGAGCIAFLERHAAELERIVLEVHLEHAAREVVEREGRLVPSGLPEPRWWFTSRIEPLEQAVWNAIEEEDLERSLLIPPDAFGPRPTTDGGAFHSRGVPLVNFLTAPFYLFDSMDRLDKVDRASLLPLTRAAIRIIRSTRGTSAKAMREAHIVD